MFLQENPGDQKHDARQQPGVLPEEARLSRFRFRIFRACLHFHDVDFRFQFLNNLRNRSDQLRPVHGRLGIDKQRLCRKGDRGFLHLRQDIHRPLDLRCTVRAVQTG